MFSPRTSAPSTPIDASRVAHRRGSVARASPSRLALFVSPAAAALAEAVAARVKLCTGLECERFTVDARSPEGVPAVDPVVLGADALTATLAGARREKENANGATAAGVRSAAALIAKGEAAVRLGDHARANDAFAEARAANDVAAWANGRRRDADADADAAEADENDGRVDAATRENARAVAAAFAPVVLTVLERSERSETPDTLGSLGAAADVRCVLDVLAKGNSARGGALIVLGSLPESAVAAARARCEGLGVAYVQCALVDFDVAHVVVGAVDAWVASADNSVRVSRIGI